MKTSLGSFFRRDLHEASEPRFSFLGEAMDGVGGGGRSGTEAEGSLRREMRQGEV